MANRDKVPIDLFENLEEASARTGYSKNEIYRCLIGTQDYVGKNSKKTYFFYEVTAGELRAQNNKRRQEEEKKKQEKLMKEWGKF